MATPTTLPASFTSGQVLTASQMNNLRGAFRVLQVVSTTKTDTFSTANTTPTNVTGLSVTITPRETASKILIMASVPWSTGPNNYTSAFMQLSGGNTATYRGDASGTSVRCVTGLMHTASADILYSTMTASLNYLDSPNTTSATTYNVQVWLTATGASPLVYVNRPTFALGVYSALSAATITALEISA